MRFLLLHLLADLVHVEPAHLLDEIAQRGLRDHAGLVEEHDAVSEGREVATGAAAALHVFGEHRWGVGVDHGLVPATEPMPVASVEGNVVYELGGRPAFDVYREFAARRGVELRPDDAASFLINNELGVLIFDRLRKARAPLEVVDGRGLRCAAEVPPGASVCILDGDADSLVAAARSAALEAKERLGRRRAAGVLLFNCICREAILGSAFGREVAAIRDVFPDTPIAGFLTYGEIARYSGRLDGWHNTTAVVAAIRE